MTSGQATNHKPGGQSLTHRKPVRTIEVTLVRSASWQAEAHRLLHLVVGDDEEEAAAAVQWGAPQGEMAVQLLRRRLHRPLLLGVPVGLLCWSSGSQKSKVQDAAVVGSLSSQGGLR